MGLPLATLVTVLLRLNLIADPLPPVCTFSDSVTGLAVVSATLSISDEFLTVDLWVQNRSAASVVISVVDLPSIDGAVQLVLSRNGTPFSQPIVLQRACSEVAALDMTVKPGECIRDSISAVGKFQPGQYLLNGMIFIRARAASRDCNVALPLPCCSVQLGQVAGR